MMLSDSAYKSELFSVATQLYVRFRRVSGRVVDAIYISENREYAQHVAALALATDDHELHHYAEKLQDLLGPDLNQPEHEEPIVEETLAILEDSYQPDEKDVYKAEVSHHYIGALR